MIPQLNVPLRIVEPVLTIDAGLPPGRYVFQLVVEDDQGRESAPTLFVVEVASVP